MKYMLEKVKRKSLQEEEEEVKKTDDIEKDCRFTKLEDKPSDQAPDQVDSEKVEDKPLIRHRIK